MQHTIKEASKLYDACKKGRTIQRRATGCSEWSDVEDFNGDYVLEEEYEYRAFPYLRVPTAKEFESMALEFTKVDSVGKRRIYLDEKSGNKLQFYYDYLRVDPQYFCWRSDCEDEKGFGRSFNGINVVLAILEKPKPRSVRLVSDWPFEGGIKSGDVWWKPENEEGFYTWEEAMEKFN